MTSTTLWTPAESAGYTSATEQFAFAPQDAVSADADMLIAELSVMEILPGDELLFPGHWLEQVYFIFEGRGLMTVGSATKQVGPGDSVFIPAELPHSLKNDGAAALQYFSVAASALEREALESHWPLIT